MIGKIKRTNPEASIDNIIKSSLFNGHQRCKLLYNLIWTQTQWNWYHQNQMNSTHKCFIVGLVVGYVNQ